MNCRDNFLTEPQTKPQNCQKKKKRKSCSSGGDYGGGACCQCVCMCHCLDVKYRGRCRKQCARSVVCNASGSAKTKQNKNAIYFAAVMRSAKRKSKTQHKRCRKRPKAAPKTQIEILIIKHAQLLRCIAGVRNLVEMTASSAMNLTRKETKKEKLRFTSRTHLMKYFLFLNLNPQAALSRSAYEPNNLKTLSPYACVALSDVQMTRRINISQMFILNN